MKKILLCATILLVACSCGQRKTAEPVTEESIDSTLYGICGEGTSMHNLQLIAGEDTLDISINDEDEDSMTIIEGGLRCDDSLMVKVKLKDDGTIKQAISITNLTTPTQAEEE